MGLDDVELVMTLEDFFGIKIPDADASKVTTVHELQSLCARLVREQRGHAFLGDDQEATVHEEVRVIISEQMRIPVERITPDSHLARDLGIGR